MADPEEHGKGRCVRPEAYQSLREQLDSTRAELHVSRRRVHELEERLGIAVERVMAHG